VHQGISELCKINANKYRSRGEAYAEHKHTVLVGSTSNDFLTLIDKGQRHIHDGFSGVWQRILYLYCTRYSVRTEQYTRTGQRKYLYEARRAENLGRVRVMGGLRRNERIRERGDRTDYRIRSDAIRIPEPRRMKRAWRSTGHGTPISASSKGIHTHDQMPGWDRDDDRPGRDLVDRDCGWDAVWPGP
jgi:hypothetical protein